MCFMCVLGNLLSLVAALNPQIVNPLGYAMAFGNFIFVLIFMVAYEREMKKAKVTAILWTHKMGKQQVQG